MNITLYYSFSLILASDVYLQSNVERLRQNYPLATKDADICKSEVAQIQKSKSTEPLEMAYQGAYQMLWAKYLSAPLSKLNSFKTGKNLMEKAIKNRYGDPEIHFLRLTIQRYAPGILKYNKNIQEDLNQILKHWDSIPQGILKKT